MTEGISSMNLIIGVAGLTICILGFVLSITDYSMDKRTHRYFIAFFTLLTAYVLCNLIGQFGESALFQTLALFFESAFSSLLTLLLTSFMLVQSGETDRRRSAAFRAAAGLEIVYLALLVYTQFSATIYYFDAEGVYHRGPFYPALLVPPVCIMLVNLLLLWSRRKRFSVPERIAFAVYILIPMACMVFQMFFFGIYVIVLGTAIAAMFMFVYIQNEQTANYIKKERENARLQTEIMLSQIQPHFLNNTLVAIGRLCSGVPEAKAALYKFTNYLQGNMDALSQTDPIPFTTELEHTKAFLELEQLRFREKLNVVYDLEATAFLLPTLTLQPVVENAVEHGVRENEDGAGTVTVSTREYPDRWEITVSDDGPGFDPDEMASDGERHIGLQNVRERLRHVCGGELRIESEPGKGCRVTIELPKETGGNDADIRY